MHCMVWRVHSHDVNFVKTFCPRFADLGLISFIIIYIVYHRKQILRFCVGIRVCQIGVWTYFSLNGSSVQKSKSCIIGLKVERSCDPTKIRNRPEWGPTSIIASTNFLINILVCSPNQGIETVHPLRPVPLLEYNGNNSVSRDTYPHSSALVLKRSLNSLICSVPKTKRSPYQRSLE